MKRPVSFGIAMLILVLVAAGFPQDKQKTPEYPESVEIVLTKAGTDIDREKQKFFTATKKVTDKLSLDLKKEVEKATKAGNLKLALALQKKLDQVSSGEFLKGMLTGESDLRKPPYLDGSGIVGRWSYAHGIVTIGANSLCTHSSGFEAKAELDEKEKRAVFRWPNGVVDWIELVPGDSETAHGGNTDGTVWEWKRVRN